MDRTTLTLAVDSTQVGTAADAFDRFVNAGNAAATSAGRVTAASIAEGRAISQVLVPAINAGINRTRSLEETKRSLGQDATRQVASARAPAAFASGVVATPQSVATGRAAPVAAPSIAINGGASFNQLAGGASSAQGAIDRLTASARNDRAALIQLAPAADVANRSFRQLASTPIRLEAQQGLSAAAAELHNVAQQAESANRAVSGLNRAGTPSFVRQTSAAQILAPQPAARAPAAPASAAPNPAGMDVFAAAVARSSAAVNELATAEGRAGETGRQLAEANARNEAAQARLASAISRATAAQAEFDSVSRSSAGNAQAIAQAQTRLQAAQAAVSVASAAATRSQRGATEAADRHRVALNSLGQQTQLTAYQQQQLSFQLNDFFVQIASGGSPLTALIQQGSQLSGTFGGIGGSLRAIGSLITPFNVAVGGAVTAVGAFGYAQYEASQRSKAFKDAIVLTGNYAGQTEEQFGEMATRISDATKTSVGAVRDMETALARTGQIGPKIFEQATEAAVRYAKTTGKSMDEVAGDIANSIASIKKDPLQFVDDSNKSGSNLFSAGDRNKVKDLQDQGKLDEAAAFAITKWNDRLKELSGNVGSFGKLLDSVKTSASQFWDFLGNLKIPSGIQASSAGFLGDAPIMTPTTAAMVAAEDEAQRKETEEKSKRGNEKAAKEAKESDIKQKGTAADERLSAFNVRANPAEGAKKTRDLFNKDLADAAASGKTYTPAQVARMRLQNALDTADPRVLQNAQVNYSTRVESFKDALDKEQAALAFHNQFMQGQYQAGAATFDKLYDTKVESIRKGVEAEVAELDKEKAATQQLLKSVIDPTQRLELQARIKRFDVEKDKVRQKGRYDEALTGQERESAQRAMTDQVDNFRANLAQSSGDDLGAALIRAQVSERQNKILAGQSGGKITDEDVKRQTALTEAAAKFADVQNRVGIVAQATAHAEEAANLLAEQSGKSLLETENDIYAVRVKTVEELGKLNARMQELARLSTDPKIKQAAADIALQYANAVDRMDPALQRLRAIQKDLASGITGTIEGGIANFGQNYVQRRQQQAQDVLNGGKAESATMSVLKTIGQTVILPIAGQVQASISKVLISDPLQKYLEGQLKGLTEGDGPLAGFFKDALGIKADPQQQALLQQTASINASRSALDLLTNAAQSAAGALNGQPQGVKAPVGKTEPASLDQPSGIQYSPASSLPPPVDSSLDGLQSDATQSLAAFSKQASSTASDVAKLANAAGAGGDAMVRLPGIVGLFQSAVAAMQAGSAASGSSGGIFGAIAGLFGGGGDAGATDAMIAAGQFHSGGIVGQASVIRHASPGVFAGAPRYHTGGIVGKAADKARQALKHNEVPAILMGGPKGKREEVLTANDPRHRDNLGMSVVARIMAESRHEGLRVRGARELGGPVSQGGMYRVNEKGPELLEVAGKQYLMMGSQGGKVEAAGSGKGGGDTHIHVQVAAQPGMSRATAQQQGAEIARAIGVSQRRNG